MTEAFFEPSRLIPFIFFLSLSVPDEFVVADADEDDGQFEPEEDDTDKARRMASESPLNKIVPIPDGTSFFVFASDSS